MTEPEKGTNVQQGSENVRSDLKPLGAAMAFAMILIWGLNRMVGLSTDEVNVLGPAIAVFGKAALDFVRPFLES